MEHIYDDRFTVYLRSDRPYRSERLLATYSSYDDARRLQQRLQDRSRQCVIRYVGPAGGGD